MEGVTLGIALLFSPLAAFLRPPLAFLAYMAALCLYPQPLTIILAGADFSTGRIVIMPLILGLMMRRGRLAALKPNWLDFFVFATYISKAIALSETVPSDIYVMRHFGAAFDTILPYVAARLAIQSKEELITFMSGMVILALPLMAVGAIYSATGWDPIAFLTPYYNMGLATNVGVGQQMRRGFYRAKGTFGISIIFGLFFTLMGAFAAGMLYQKKWKTPLVVALWGCMAVGALASMSSAPLFALVVTTGMLACFTLRRFWAVPVFTFILSLMFVEVYSNRHFYHVLTILALDQATAYYRIGLIEECFGGGMTGHWFSGYGYVGIGPGNDNTNFHWFHKDLVNIYIQVLVRFGLIGLIPFIMMNILFFKRLVQAARDARTLGDKWLVWSITSGLVGWNVAFLTVGALSQVETILFISVAICCNMPMMMRAAAAAQSPAPAPAPARNSKLRRRAPIVFRPRPLRRRHA